MFYGRKVVAILSGPSAERAISYRVPVSSTAMMNKVMTSHATTMARMVTYCKVFLGLNLVFKLLLTGFATILPT